MTYYINTLIIKNIYIYNTTFWIWKSLHLDIFEKKKKKKKNDKLIYRENVYKAIAFLNSFTLMTSKFTRSLGGRLFHKTEVL